VITDNILVQQMMFPMVSDKFSSVCGKFWHCGGKTAVRSLSSILLNLICSTSLEKCCFFLQLFVDIKIDSIEIVVLNHFTYQDNNHSSGNWSSVLVFCQSAGPAEDYMELFQC
jgi:hypothetical protein